MKSNYSNAPIKVGSVLLAATVGIISFGASVSADLAVVAIDRKIERVKGKGKAVKNPAPDTVMVLDLASSPPKILGEVPANTAVAGPPITISVAPDESIAIASGGRKMNAAGKIKKNNTITVIDLQASPPKKIDELVSGPAAAGVAISPKGNLALVANRDTNTVSVFGISGKKVTKLTDVIVGKLAKSGPSGIAFAPDGKTALVTMDKDHGLAILSIDGQKVTTEKRILTTSVRPYAVDISSTGKLAVAANMGRGKGDMDTISLIDMSTKPIQVINTLPVGQQPEGAKFSPDGKFLAVALQNGSQYNSASPFYNDHGRLIVYSVNGTTIKKLDETKIHSWSQGVLFSKDNKKVYVQSMMGKQIQILSWNGSKLADTGKTIDLKGGGASMNMAF